MTIIVKKNATRLTMPYAPTDKSPPYLFNPLLIKMMITHKAEFNKNGDNPMASISLMIFMSKTKSFLSKCTNSFLFVNSLKRYIKGMVCAKTVAIAAPRIPMSRGKMKSQSKKTLATTVIMVAIMASLG